MFFNGVFILISFIPKYSHGSFVFDWLGWSDSKGPNVTYKGIPLMQIPFEELPPEDKFLVEASKIAGFKLSELDACQHRLVMKLKSSCGSLSEEELAKFSVNLLNCQAAVEGRKEFPCEEKMTLKQCTIDMDPETWNAYHIMNNRARAVCYASRQQQFQATTEMTVNKLMSTVHSYIDALSSAQKESNSLKGGTSITLNEIEKSQRDVLNRQRSLASISLLISGEIERSLSAANNQKEVLTDFRKELAKHFTNLQNRLDIAEKQVTANSGSVKDSYSNIVNDLKDISDVATEILNKIDSSSKKVLENNDVALEQFKNAMESMKEINLSIGYIMSVVETIRGRSSVVSDFVGQKGEHLEEFILLSKHCICLIIAMIIASFMSTPWTSRVALLLASTLNAYTSFVTLSNRELNYPKIDLFNFYIGYLVFSICDWIIRILLQLTMNKKLLTPLKQNDSMNNTNIHSLNPRLNDNKMNDIHSRYPLVNNHHSNYDDTPVANKVNNWLSENRSAYPSSNRFRSSNLNGDVRDLNINDDVHSQISSPAPSVSGRSVDGRSICTAVSKRTGQRCRKRALKSSNLCSIHDR